MNTKSATQLPREELAIVDTSTKDMAAWSAAISGDVPSLDAALARGANPNAVHPTFGHCLLEQACRHHVNGSVMAAMLIERGAELPQPESHLAWELCWRAISDDSVLLAKQIMLPPLSLHGDGDEKQGGSPLREYFLREKSKFVTASSTSLDFMMQAIAAQAAVMDFANRHSQPLATSHTESGNEVSPYRPEARRPRVCA